MSKRSSKKSLSQPESTTPRAKETSQNCASRNVLSDSLNTLRQPSHSKIFLSLLILWTIIVYLNTLTNSFVFDDEITVTNNIFIRSLANIGYLFSKEYFTLSGEESYRPFITFTYMIDYFLWELNPAGYHLTNLLLHILSVFSFYLLIVNLWQDRPFALMATAVFALSPVNTEAINAISFREDLLITPLCLFSLIAHRNLQIPSLPERKRRLFKPASSMLYLLALFSKEMAIVLPIIAMAIDYYRDKKLILKNYLGYVTVFILYIILRFFILSNPEASTPEEAGVAIPDFVSRITWVPFIISFYLRLLLFPVNLVADYGGTINLNPWNIALLIILVCLFIKSKNDRIKISIAWFLISLIPILNIIPIRHPVAERYLYFPAIAASILLSSLIYQVKNKQVSIFICLLLFFSLLTFERNRIWNNDYILWNDTVEKVPQSFGGHYNLGIQYNKKGLLDKAANEYKTAIGLNPNSAEAHFSIGNIYFKQDNMDAAIEEYKTALKIRPDHSDAAKNLQLAYRKVGNLKEIIEEKNNVVAPQKGAEYYNNMGITYAKHGQPDKAIEQFKIAIRLRPDYAEAYNNIGNIYYNQGRLEEAIDQFQVAMKLNPNEPAHYNSLGIAYFEQKKVEEAIRQFQIALNLNPDFIEGHFNLGVALLSKGLKDMAKKEFEITLKLKPDHVQAQSAMATLKTE